MTGPPLLPGPLVSPDWLASWTTHPDLVVADVRWFLDGRSGAAAYVVGHISGAVFVDLVRDLAGPPDSGGGRHPLPAPDAFAAAMTRLGIGDDTVVVAYDDAGGSVAARLWWMLDVLGHPAAVLDGGIDAWHEPLLPGEPPVAHTRRRFTARPWPAEAIADFAVVSHALGDPSVVVLDARTPARYRGEPNTIDGRFGHVPGAHNAPWAANLTSPAGPFLDAAALRDRYRALGAGPGHDIICHCGSGVTACHDLLALRLAGFSGARLYPGSWSDWAARPEAAISTGDQP